MMRYFLPSQHAEVSEVYREKVYEFLAYIRVNFALRAFAR